MIEKVKQLVADVIPDSHVDFQDFKNDGRHFLLTVTSSVFVGMPLIDQHRMVMNVLKVMIDSGELHAVKIKTQTP